MLAIAHFARTLFTAHPHPCPAPVREPRQRNVHFSDGGGRMGYLKHQTGQKPISTPIPRKRMEAICEPGDENFYRGIMITYATGLFIDS
jgi:hypothetical protein